MHPKMHDPFMEAVRTQWQQRPCAAAFGSYRAVVFNPVRRHDVDIPGALRGVVAG